MSEAPERAELVGPRELVTAGVLDAELGGLLWLLADAGLPIVLAGRERAACERIAAVLPGTSGALVADSLEEVVRLAGGSAATGLPDELRDLGVVVVVRASERGLRVSAVHYVRPLERDAGGHVQRRGPAVLAVWDEHAARWEHFAWAISAELAERAGMSLADFERRWAEIASALG